MDYARPRRSADDAIETLQTITIAGLQSICNPSS
jgi:hypothetical protein